MFGMSLGELFLIAIIALLFLGPDKLPSAMVEIAKFFKGAKEMFSEAKNTLQTHIDDVTHDTPIEEIRTTLHENTQLLNESLSQKALDKLIDKEV